VKGRVALVTGGASGIGAAIAKLLAERGATVAITDLGFQEKSNHLEIRADNREPVEIRQAVAAVEKKLGRVDILVNNAGTSGRSLPLEDVDEKAFDDLLDTHVKGAFFYTQAVVGGMKARRFGRIITISSHFALIGSPNMSHYSGAKAALHGLTRSWARELAPWGITANLVAPGLTETPLTRRTVGVEELKRRGEGYPLGRLPNMDEPAYAVAWLASDEAAMVTAQTISPNGGIAIVGY
jgi:NAD(P)-dependent dehydrogenase (short-subunit alcohol dehydrogenase family)